MFGMVERGEGLGLALEAREALGIARHVGGQHLERDVASELRVGRAIDLAHSAGADGGGDAVVGERAADHPDAIIASIPEALDSHAVHDSRIS